MICMPKALSNLMSAEWRRDYAGGLVATDKSLSSRRSGHLFCQLLYWLLLFFPLNAFAVGVAPVPNIRGATVSASVKLEQGPPASSQYLYSYEFTAPNSATGQINRFALDASSRFRDSTGARTFPIRGGDQTRLLGEFVDLLQSIGPFEGQYGSQIIEGDMLAPLGWNGGATRSGTLIFYTAPHVTGVLPGSTLSGFSIRSSRPPMLREYALTPSWALVVGDSADETDRLLAQADLIGKSLPVVSTTLGPLDKGLGGSVHLTRLKEALIASPTLGWVTDAELNQNLLAFVDAAIVAGQAADGTEVVTQIEAFKAEFLAANTSVYSSEYAALVILNADSLLAHTLPTPRPPGE